LLGSWLPLQRLPSRNRSPFPQSNAKFPVQKTLH
jgi:hypothetical protein